MQQIQKAVNYIGSYFYDTKSCEKNNDNNDQIPYIVNTSHALGTLAYIYGADESHIFQHTFETLLKNDHSELEKIAVSINFLEKEYKYELASIIETHLNNSKEKSNENDSLINVKNYYKTYETINSASEKTINIHAKKIGVEVKKIFKSYQGILQDPSKFINANISCMVDGKEKQNSLKEKLEDTSYSKENFIGFKESKNPSETFIACFKNEKELEFSNRNPTNNELRGYLLKTALGNNNYANLMELVSKGHLTENDNMLKYALSITKNNCYNNLKHENLLNEQEMIILNKELSAMKIGNTTLDKLWGLKVE